MSSRLTPNDDDDACANYDRPKGNAEKILTSPRTTSSANCTPDAETVRKDVNSTLVQPCTSLYKPTPSNEVKNDVFAKMSGALARSSSTDGENGKHDSNEDTVEIQTHLRPSKMDYALPMRQKPPILPRNADSSTTVHVSKWTDDKHDDVDSHSDKPPQKTTKVGSNVKSETAIAGIRQTPQEQVEQNPTRKIRCDLSGKNDSSRQRTPTACLSNRRR